MTATLALTFTPLGVLVVRRGARAAVGWLMTGIGLSATAAALAICWSGLLVPAWVSQWSWLPPLVGIPLVLLYFPDSALPSPRWRPLAVLLVAAAALATVAVAWASLSAPRTFLTSLEDPSPSGRVLARVALAGVALVVLGTAGVLVSLAIRWRRGTDLTRRQLTCLAPTAVLFVLGIALEVLNVPGAWVAAVAALPFGLTVAIMRYTFDDLDLYLHRGLVWLIMTAAAVAAYTLALLAVMQASRRWDPSTSAWLGTLVAGASAAIVLLPAERLAQRAVNRLFFGRRDDPYAVLAALGRDAERVADPLAVLPRLAASLVESLRVPCVAISVSVEQGEPIVVERGRSAASTQSFPMVAHGVEIGELVIAQRRPGARFGTAEDHLLRELARSVAGAAEAVRSTLELQRARERLVLAREEERRRLRRDLHDGVASKMFAARLKTAAAEQLSASDPALRALLASLGTNLESCADEVRSLIDGLRPAVLDRGLVAALHQLVEGNDASGVTLSLQVPDALDDLPAAIEVVVLRIATEAVTNVWKHAQATRCQISLRRRDAWLELEVADDGAGFPDEPPRPKVQRHPVGLGSLRSRAVEIGGTFSLTSTRSGTTVLACFPLSSPSSGTTAARPTAPQL